MVGLLKKVFISFWATFVAGDLSNSFMGNIEVTAGELGLDAISISGMDDLKFLEGYIKHKINTDVEEEVKVLTISIVNWKPFE